MNEALLFSAELDDIPFLQGCHKINHLMNVKTKFIQEQIIILIKIPQNVSVTNILTHERSE